MYLNCIILTFPEYKAQSLAVNPFRHPNVIPTELIPTLLTVARRSHAYLVLEQRENIAVRVNAKK
jgi:hypothetical protein